MTAAELVADRHVAAWAPSCPLGAAARPAANGGPVR